MYAVTVLLTIKPNRVAVGADMRADNSARFFSKGVR